MSPGEEQTMFRLVVVFAGLASTSSLAGRTEPGAGSWFVAAVYEHSVVLNPDPRVPLSRPAALQHMHNNLRVYEQQAALAAQQGAQILVFPEDGLQGFNFSRSSISGYLETIPDPKQESWNPCTEPGKHNNTEVLQRLSCMARRYNLYLVANMADLQLCPPKTGPSSCPSDGRWQFNTNVVFRSDGLLVARYHKHNLYFEEAFDKPPRPEITTFDTPFAGTFGLITCFDILFQEPTLTLLEKGVRQMIFPTAWMNQLPLLDTIQFQRAFSSGANVTLLAANIRSDRLIMTGSGIYTPTSATYHHAQRGDPEEGRLLVARVPVLDPVRMEHRGITEEEIVWGQSTSSTASGYCPEENCFETAPPETASSVPPSSSTTTTFISSMMYDPYTFVLLNETQGEARVCNGTFCCRLQYRRLAPGGSRELYALGAFAGTHTVNGRYALQVCALVRCAGMEVTSCGQEVEEAESKMDFLLEGWFGTRYVYPSVLVNGLVLEQPEHLETSADGRVTMKHSKMEDGLVTACLYGRMYHLDQE